MSSRSIFGLWYAKDYTDPAVSSIDALAALTAEEVGIGIERGCSWYDLGGGPPSIVAYKLSCGARLAHYIDIDITAPVVGQLQRLWRGSRTLGMSARRSVVTRLRHPALGPTAAV